MVVETHDHACFLYATPEQQREVIARAIRAALARGDRFLYVLDPEADTGVLEAIRREGIDIEDALDDGALVIKSTSEAYLKGGTFDPERMIGLLRAAIQEALDDGFHGLTAAGEMTWATRGAPGSEKLLEYERRVHAIFADHPVGAICQYDVRRFDPAALDAVLRAHPHVVAQGGLVQNPSYETT